MPASTTGAVVRMGDSSAPRLVCSGGKLFHAAPPCAQLRQSAIAGFRRRLRKSATWSRWTVRLQRAQRTAVPALSTDRRVKGLWKLVEGLTRCVICGKISLFIKTALNRKCLLPAAHVVSMGFSFALATGAQNERRLYGGCGKPIKASRCDYVKVAIDNLKSKV